MISRAGGGSFIVNLVPDDGRMVFVMFENLADHSLAIKSVRRIRKVGILAVTVIQILPAEPCYDNLRMFPIEPGGDRSGRRAHDDANSGGVKLLHGAIHPREFKLAVFR